MEHFDCASYGNVRIRPLCSGDIQRLREWRNDKRNSEYLSPLGFITPEMQESWFRSYLQDPSIRTFAIDELRDLNCLAGSVSIYDFDGSSAELGKLIVGAPQAHGKGVGFYGFLLAAFIAFSQLGAETLRCSVHEDNTAARVIYSRIGFAATGEHPFAKGGHELEMTLPRTSFEHAHNFLKEIKIYRQTGAEI